MTMILARRSSDLAALLPEALILRNALLMSDGENADRTLRGAAGVEVFSELGDPFPRIKTDDSINSLEILRGPLNAAILCNDLPRVDVRLTPNDRTSVAQMAMDVVNFVTGSDGPGPDNNPGNRLTKKSGKL